MESIKRQFRFGVFYSLVFLFGIVSLSNVYAHSKDCLSVEYIDQEEACYCDFCKEICAYNSIQTFKEHKADTVRSLKQKNASKLKRTVMIYMAADNDLRIFAARNIQQMAAVGSNKNVTIAVHLDIRLSGNKKVTRRYIIEKNKVIHVEDAIEQQPLDSGNPVTLISFCEWTIKNYPADTYDLFAWNHGTGILEPLQGKIVHPMELFVFNPSTHLLELDRSMSFLDIIDGAANNQRGICWDDSTGNYLSNRKLDAALETIRKKFMNNEKFGIIGFDACLMSMAEITSFIKKHAQVMVSSQEVELGMGWKYDDLFYPFTYQGLDTQAFARHIVESYEKTYQAITYDYTLSAINLSKVQELENNIHQVATMLLEGLTREKNIYSNLIKSSRNKHYCTHFDEPSYIDLYDLYNNLENNLKNAQYMQLALHKKLKSSLLETVKTGKMLIEQAVIANVTGKNLQNAHGISIYFPERSIHSSYKEALFLASNNWGRFLSAYLFN